MKIGAIGLSRGIVPVIHHTAPDATRMICALGLPPCRCKLGTPTHVSQPKDTVHTTVVFPSRAVFRYDASHPSLVFARCVPDARRPRRIRRACLHSILLVIVKTGCCPRRAGVSGNSLLTGIFLLHMNVWLKSASARLTITSVSIVFVSFPQEFYCINSWVRSMPPILLGTKLTFYLITEVR